MRNTKPFRALVAVMLSAIMLVPHPVVAAGQRAQKVDGIEISNTVKKVVLDQGTTLKGAIVDAAGNPVANAPLVIGQQGKFVTKLATDADGRYEVTGLKQGYYQVASFAGVQNIQVVDAKSAPKDSVRGVVQVINDEGIARGQNAGRFEFLMQLIRNPLVWAIIIAIGIAIPLAIDDDDAS